MKRRDRIRKLEDLQTRHYERGSRKQFRVGSVENRKSNEEYVWRKTQFSCEIIDKDTSLLTCVTCKRPFYLSNGAGASDRVRRQCCSPVCMANERRLTRLRTLRKKTGLPAALPPAPIWGCADYEQRRVDYARAVASELLRQRDYLRRRTKLATGTMHPYAIAYTIERHPSLLPLALEKMPQLDNYQLGLIRQKITEIVGTNLEIASAVLSTTSDTTWSPQQVRLFGMLLDKAVPSLSQSNNLNLSANVDLASLSRDDLMRIALQGAPTTGATIDHQPAADPVPPDA
jgi:hypothetical protein